MKMPGWGLRCLRFLRSVVRRLLRPIRSVVGWDGFWWVAGMVAVLAVGVFLSWRFWDELRGDQDSLSTTIRNLGLVIGGVIAILLAIWRSTVSERQADTAQQSLLNERYERRAEMLGSDVLSVRLGGIYALQRFAQEHPKEYHVQVLGLLCAFVRHPKEDEVYQRVLAEENADPKTFSFLREDVQAVMDWIGSRGEAQIAIEKDAKFELDLKGADLVHGQFIDANLSGAMLQEANLSRANIASTDLSGAYVNYAVLKDAKLTDVDLTGARVWNIDLSDSRMFKVTMPCALDDANLSGANLQEVNLSGAHIQYSDLSNANIGADLSGSFFLESKLSQAHILGSDLSGARILRTDMSGALLRDTNLTGTYFYDPRGGTGSSPVTGLTQAQLDAARADPDNPPRLDGVLDAETGKPLVWRGKPLESPSA